MRFDVLTLFPEKNAKDGNQYNVTGGQKACFSGAGSHCDSDLLEYGCQSQKNTGHKAALTDRRIFFPVSALPCRILALQYPDDRCQQNNCHYIPDAAERERALTLSRNSLCDKGCSPKESSDHQKSDLLHFLFKLHIQILPMYFAGIALSSPASDK